MAGKPHGGAEDWIPLPLDKGLFANLDPDVVTSYDTALENAFINELGGISRFPGLVTFADFSGVDNSRVHGLRDFEGDLIATTQRGSVFRIGQNGIVTNCTSVPVSGGQRTIMAPTNQELLLAGGGPIVRLRQATTELLSEEAPNAAYIGWIDGYTIACEVNTFDWFYANPGVVDQWPALNSEAADSTPDNITAFLIDPYRELLFCGANKIEQWERLTTGTDPFFRRYACGEGIKLPYGIVWADNSVFIINAKTELVKFNQQISQNVGGEIGLLLEEIDDWTDSWIGGYPDRPLNVVGQKFILIQAPNATNEYGTKGVTLIFDYRNKKFFQIYGWDSKQSVPTRWPGWSHWPAWDNVYVGGEGKVYQLTTNSYANDGNLQRWLVRTSHISQGNMFQITNFRLRLKRGIGSANAAPPTIRVRCRRDAGPFSAWINRDLGVSGDNIQFKNFGPFGTATSFMFEISTSDPVPVNLVKAEVKGFTVGH
ncbi:MAG: hypothetical protein ABSA68_13410 [Xanthobacteraceae bacterium]|jgi:hypothetical protein